MVLPPPPPPPQRRPPRHDASQSAVRSGSALRQSEARSRSRLSEARSRSGPALRHSRACSESSDDADFSVQTRPGVLRGRLGVEVRDDEQAPKTSIAKLAPRKVGKKKHSWERQWWWQESAWDERGDVKASGCPKVEPSNFSDEQVSELLNDILVEHNLGGKIRIWLQQRPKLVLVHFVHVDLKQHAPVKDHTVMKYTNDIIAWLWDQDTEGLMRAYQSKHALSDEALRELKQVDRWVQLAIMGGSWNPGIPDKSAVLLQQLADLEALNRQVDWRQRPKVRLRSSTTGESPSPVRTRRTPSPLRGRPSDSEGESLSDSSDDLGEEQRSFASPVSSIMGERALNPAGNCSAGLVGVLKSTGFVYGFITCDEALTKYSKSDVFIFFKSNPDVFGKPCDTLVEFNMFEHTRRGVIAVDAVEFDLDSFIYASSLKISLASSLRSMKPESQAKLLNRVTHACNTWGPPSNMARLVVQQMREVKDEHRRNAKRQLMPPPPSRQIAAGSAEPPSKWARTRQPSMQRSASRSLWPSASRTHNLSVGSADADWRTESMMPSMRTATPSPESEASSPTPTAEPRSTEQSRAEAAARNMLTTKGRELEAKLRREEAVTAGRDKVSMQIPSRRKPAPATKLMEGIEPTPVASPSPVEEADAVTLEALTDGNPNTERRAAEAAAKDLLSSRAKEMEARLIQLRSASPQSTAAEYIESSVPREHSMRRATPAAIDSPNVSQQQERSLGREHSRRSAMPDAIDSPRLRDPAVTEPSMRREHSRRRSLTPVTIDSSRHSRYEAQDAMEASMGRSPAMMPSRSEAGTEPSMGREHNRRSATPVDSPRLRDAAGTNPSMGREHSRRSATPVSIHSSRLSDAPGTEPSMGHEHSRRSVTPAAIDSPRIRDAAGTEPSMGREHNRRSVTPAAIDSPRIRDTAGTEPSMGREHSRRSVTPAAIDSQRLRDASGGDRVDDNDSLGSGDDDDLNETIQGSQGGEQVDYSMTSVQDEDRVEASLGIKSMEADWSCDEAASKEEDADDVQIVEEESLMLGENCLEVVGLNGSPCMSGPSPGALLVEMLNGTLADLPWYQADAGPPVLRSWKSESGELRMELQSTRLCTSALRVLDGLKVHNRQVHARIV